MSFNDENGFEVKKRNVYTKILLTDYLFSKINKANQNKWNEISGIDIVEVENKPEQIDNLIIGPDKKFILHNMFTDKKKRIAMDIFRYMDEYKFKNSSSVPHNVMKYGFDPNITYDGLADIDLEFHTIHCATCVIEIIKDTDLAETLKDLMVLAALLHDFGKEEIISKRYKLDTLEGHHVVSSRFVERNFKKYIDKDLSIEEYRVLVKILSDHHDEKANQNILLKILREGDIMSRKREHEYRIVYNQDGGISL